MTSIKLLTKKALKAFLGENLKKRFKARDKGICPIAKFTNFAYNATGKNKASVRGNGIITVNEKEFSTPGWVEKFIDEVDNSGSSTITGAQALALL